MKTCLYSILIPAVLCASPTSSAAGFGKTPAAAAYTAAGGDSLVYLPLNREVALSARTGSTRSFGREEFDKYPSPDFRNLLTGVIPGLEVVEKSGATGISAASDNAAVNLLARGNAIRYIVDDMPVYITQLQLNTTASSPFSIRCALIPAINPWAAASSYPVVPLTCPAK